MNNEDKTKAQLIAELEELQRRVAELESGPGGGETQERWKPGDGSCQVGELTGQSEVEQERDRLRTILTAAVECLPFSFWALDAQGRYVLANAAARALWGEIIGQRPADVAGDEKRLAAWLDNHRRAWAGEKVENEAEFMVSGEARSFHNVLGPIRMGEDIIGILGFNEDITERKRMETALRETEKLFQAFMDNAPGVAWIKDEQGHFLYINKRCGKFLGVPREEWIGKTDFDLWPKELAEQYKNHDLEVLTSGQVMEFVEEAATEGGNSCWWSFKFPFRYATGKMCVGGIAVDITERLRAEEALQKAHDELEEEVKKRTAELSIFRRFAEASGRGFGMADLDGRISYVNPTLCRLFGEEKPEDVIGKDVSTYYTQEDKQKMADEIIPAVLRDGSWQGERLICSRHGTLTPALQSNFLIQDEDGQPIRLGVVVADISELRKAEEAVQRSEERFELAVRGAGVGIWDWDIRTGKVYFSPRWKKLFGYEEHEIGDSFEDWSRLLHPDEGESIIKLQADFLAGSSPTVTAEYRLRHKDGSYRWIEAHAIVVRNKEGKACRLVGSHGDITKRKLAEEAVEQERQSLWRMLQASDHERRIISYEIHDGLAQYLAAAGMQFQRYDALREKSPHKAQKAHETAVELVRQSYLEARRLISEVRPPIIDEIGLEMGISHLVHEQRRQGAPKIHFESNVQFERLTPILENALYRIAQEALSNACKHSRSKKVTVSLSQEGQEACLTVQDWGIGFDPEAVGKGHFGVEGIRQRVRLLGGRLTIESTPGSGTLIRAVVPILEQRSEE
jgi:PAS domain S-box-containing protein